MEGAENAVDPVGREALFLRRDQITGCLVNKFAGFGNELLMQRVHAGTPARIAA